MEPQTDEELALSIQSVRVTRRRVTRSLLILLLLTAAFVALFVYFVSHGAYASWMMIALLFCFLNVFGFAVVLRQLNGILAEMKAQQALGQITRSEEGVWPPAPKSPGSHK